MTGALTWGTKKFTHNELGRGYSYSKMAKLSVVKLANHNLLTKLLHIVWIRFYIICEGRPPSWRRMASANRSVSTHQPCHKMSYLRITLVFIYRVTPPGDQSCSYL